MVRTKQTSLWSRCNPGLLAYGSSRDENKEDSVGSNNPVKVVTLKKVVLSLYS